MDSGLSSSECGVQLISRLYLEGVEINTVYGTGKLKSAWTGQTTVFMETPMGESRSYMVKTHFGRTEARMFHRLVEDFVSNHNPLYVRRALESEGFDLLFRALGG